MEKTPITKTISIEDLVDDYSFAIDYLAKKGIRCLRCGEPIWGTLEEAAKEKKFSAEDIDLFVSELNIMAEESVSDSGGNKKLDINIGRIES